MRDIRRHHAEETTSTLFDWIIGRWNSQGKSKTVEGPARPGAASLRELPDCRAGC